MSKILLFCSITLIGASQAFSDSTNCDEQVRSTISNWLDDDQQLISFERQINFNQYIVYSAIADTKQEGTQVRPSIPYRSTIKILVEKNSPLGGCSPIDAVVEEVQ